MVYDHLWILLLLDVCTFLLNKQLKTTEFTSHHFENLSSEVWQCNVISGVVSFVVSVGVVDLHRVQSWTDETVWLPVLSAGYVSITLSLGLHCCCRSMLCWPWCFQWTVGLFYRYVSLLIFNTNIFVKALKVQTREGINNNNNRFFWDYSGEPVPKETFTHPPSRSSSSLYQLLPSTTIRSIILVQITWLVMFLHNLSPHSLWATSWSEALHLIFHTFLHPIIVFFSQHMHIPSHRCCPVSERLAKQLSKKKILLHSD